MENIENHDAFLLKLSADSFNLTVFLKDSFSIVKKDGVEEEDAVHLIYKAYGLDEQFADHLVDEDFQVDESDSMENAILKNIKQQLSRSSDFLFFIISQGMVSKAIGDEIEIIDGSRFEADEDEAGTESWYGVYIKRIKDDFYFFKGGLFLSAGEKLCCLKMTMQWENDIKDYLKKLAHT